MTRKFMQLITTAGCAATLAAPVAAQDAMQRRSGGGDAPASSPAKALTIPPIPADPAHPFAGVWVGTVKTAFGEDPCTVAIEFLNGEYTGYSSPGAIPRVAAPHLHNTLSGKALRWEQTNMGGNGVLIFTVEAIDLNHIKGVMTTRDVKWPAGSPDPGGTFEFKRRLLAK